LKGAVEIPKGCFTCYENCRA